ncbi:MAG: hypothetical protein FWF97_03055 [Alphaproteobacteria bacterium]|nr:hypothetical protein [Alphaproteobacteria bacterium]
MGQLVSDVTDVLNYNKGKKTAATERQKILEQMAADEKAKTNLVKKTLATQRAKYGAGGMSGKGMTEEAVLKRLREETEEPFDLRKKANKERLSKIKVKKPNLLKMIISKIDGMF